MTTSLLRAAFVATLFLAGCGGSEDADPATTDAAADSKGASKKKGAANPSRADEIIKDLKEREAKQADIQKAQDASKPSGIPVVVEFTPGAPGKGGKGGSASYVHSYSAQPSGAYSTSAGPAVDANVLRQEIAVAEARLQENQRKLEQARQRLTAANSQMTDQNAAVRQMGQGAARSAQQEVSALEQAISQDRYALDAARSRAMSAGVPR